MTNRRPAGVMLLTLLVAGCADDRPATVSATQDNTGTAAVPVAAEQTPSGPIDQALASTGEALFQAKACIGCHTIGGGKLTGPDLAGVTERRDYGWFVSMVTNPDSMLKVDPIAKQLFAEYMTPMLNMGITRDEARAIYEYLRREGT